MKIQLADQKIFFDVEGPEFVMAGNELRQLPTLILIHGAPGHSDHSVFKPAFSVLRDICRIVYLDLSGAGRSGDPPDHSYSLENWADDLVEFCDQMDIKKPVVLGVSAGGFVAMAYGIRHPQHPGKLVLASTQAKMNVERSIAEFANKSMSFYNTTPQPPRDSVIFRAKLAKAFHSLGGIWHKMDLLDDLGKIKAPTLVLSGTDDPVTPLQDSIDIVERLSPDIVQFEVVKDTGHAPWRDKPEEAFAIIRAFILAKLRQCK